LYALLFAALPQVSVDWSSIPDAVIARCDLSGLEAMVLQGMVDEGYAVVRSVPPGGIALMIRADDDQFLIEGARNERTARLRVAIPRECDSTIQVEIVAAMRTVSDDLSAELPLPETRTATIAEPTPAPIAEPLSWRLFGGVGAVLPSATGMFAIRLGARYRIEEVWFAGLVLEGSVRPTSGVTVYEPVLAAQGVFELWSSTSGIALLIGLEAGLLAHLYSRDDGSGGHADGRFGVLFEGRLPILGATLSVLPYVRLIPVRQQVGSEDAFVAHHFGVVLALSVSFDL
jgi:hypothetical protein